VPDGEIQVCAYHRNKIYGKDGFQPAVLAILATLDPRTMPSPELRLNYDYGDVREAIALHAGAFTYLQVSRDNPAGSNLTQAPSITSRISYGFFGAVGTLNSANSISTTDLLAYYEPCELAPADIEAANLGRTCPSSDFIYPSASTCYNATRLFENWQCSSCRTVDIRSFTSPGEPVNTRPTKQPQRPVSPFNYIISGIAIEQTRAVQTPCAPPSGEARFGCDVKCQEDRKRIFGSFYEQSMCVEGTNVSSAPFGIDPAFLSSSSVFSGKLHPEDVGYDDGDLTTAGVPFGFFSSAYKIPDRFGSDAISLEDQSASVTGGDPKFRVYLDSRFGRAETLNAISYLREGYFLDNLTKTVDVSLLTFNPIKDVFALCTVSFTFLDGGQIETSVLVKSRALSDFHTSEWRIFVMVCIIMGSAAILRTELSEIYHAWKSNDLKSYFGDAWNLLDFASFLSIPCSIITYDLIGQQVLATFPLAVNGTVPYVLRDVNTPARIFRTDPENEIAFLESVTYVRSLMGFLDFYSFWIGFNIMILTARFFKILHFQGRMGLITRTFSTALQDIIHFGMIFFLVIFAYGVMGVLLFGHQLSEYRTMGTAMMTLIQTTLAISNDDYARMLDSNNNIMTTIFYLSFLFLSTITLLNIFLAILIDAFSTVKESSSHSETLMSGLLEVLMHDFRHVKSKIASVRQGHGHPTRFIPDHKLKQLFEAWAFSLEDEEAIAEKKKEKEKEEIVKDGVLRLEDGTEIGAAELSVMMLKLIAEAPDKLEELYSGQNRGMQLRSAITNFVSMAPGAAGVGGKRGSAIAPEGNGGSSVDSMQQKLASIKSPTTALSLNYWRKVRDIYMEEKEEKEDNGGLRDLEEQHDRSESTNVRRLAKALLARYGEDGDSEMNEEDTLKIIQAQVMQKQVQQFQQTANIEDRVSKIEAMVEKMGHQMDRLAGRTI